jgi:hypothetical protein
MHENTYHGLMKWYSAEIEKFGWMVIFSQSDEKPDYKSEKLNLYLRTLNELKDAIKDKVDEVTEADRKKDLLIIHKKLLEFIPIASDTLSKNFSQYGGAKKAKKSSKKTSKKTSKKKSKKQMEW